MTAKKSTKTNKPAQEMDTTTPDQDKATPTVEDTAAEASASEPAANPANQPAVEPATDCPMGDSDSGEAGDDPSPNMTSHEYDDLHGLTSNIHDDSDSGAAGDDPGPNMTSHEYDDLHGLTSNVHDDSVSGEQPPLAILTAKRLGLSPRQHITSIIAGGVISGILARTKPYEMLDLRKAAEAIGMCDAIVEMILHLDDAAPEAPDEQPVS